MHRCTHQQIKIKEQRNKVLALESSSSVAEITFDSVDQVHTGRVLQAATTDNVGELEDLIRRDPNILHKFSLSSFTETPLNISSLRGHLESPKSFQRKNLIWP